MGISDRKEREKEELRAAILSAAKRLFLDKGVAKTSIRNIADEIEYSPGIIYHYFQNKDDIFHALHTQGFSQMNEKMSVLSVVADPMERLKAMGKIYIDFALENPDMYDLMFIKEDPIDHLHKSDSENWKEGSTTFNGLRATIEACIAKGHFKDQSVEPLSYLIWSSVHGMVSLKIRQRTEVVPVEAQESIVQDGYEALLLMMDAS